MTRIQAAIDKFRDAAILPDRWPQALDSLAAALCSEGATLVLKPTRRSSIAVSTNIQPLVQEYMSRPVADPREQRVSPQMDQLFMTDYAYFSHREIARDAYYQEFLVPRGFGWNAAAALDDDLLVSMKRGVRRGPYDGADLALLNAALPWLRAASRTACMTWRSGFTGQLNAFERIDRGAVLVDEHARVLQTNACVTFGDGLDVAGGILQAPRAADRLRLHRYLAGIMSSGPATLILPRPSGLRSWILDAIACSDAVRSLHSRAAVLLLITDLERPARLSRELSRQFFGLTQTEASLARELCCGKSLRQASALLTISEGHARQRLKALFCKTGTSRQGELIALLLKLH